MKTIKAYRAKGMVLDSEGEKKVPLFFFEYDTEPDEIDILVEVCCTSCGTSDPADIALLCAECQGTSFRYEAPLDIGRRS